MFEGKATRGKVPFDAKQIVFETPLYEIIDLTEDTAQNFADLFNVGKTKVDGYCIGCSRESVFHSAGYSSGKSVTHFDMRGIRTARFVCARDKDHVICIITEMDSGFLDEKLNLAFRKIGQIPTHADIANGNLGNFSSVLKGIDRSELIRANGLAAHGVNIGAFVYLRRVFERLIHRAKGRLKSGPSEADFSALRMDEKIEVLAGVLPDFLPKNRRIYAVLSKGIHELDEDTCGKLYELMRTSIILMLEQERDTLERETREKELTKLISGLQT